VSEEQPGGTREREEHFGRVVLHSDNREVYSLDLYETHTPYAPGLVCRGYYLPRARSRRWPDPVPVGVELSLDYVAYNGLYEMFGGGTFGREGDAYEPDAPYSGDFELGGTWRDEIPFFHAEVSAPLRLHDRTVWTGSLEGMGRQGRGEFDFILEQYGTIEPVVFLLVILYFTVFYDRDGRRHAEDCYRQALRQCGDAGNIKSLGPTSAVTGATFRRDIGCQIECFERWHPSAHEGVDPPEAREDSP
jgi:hypothetical protein